MLKKAQTERCALGELITKTRLFQLGVSDDVRLHNICLQKQDKMLHL